MKVIIVRGRAIVPSVNKVATALAQDGYDVKLLVWDRQNTLPPQGADEYTRYTFNLKAPYDKPSALFFFPFWWMYQFLFLLRNRADVVHACDLDTLLPAIAIRLLKRVRLCYTIYDFYASNLPDGRFLLARKAIRSAVAAVERFGIRFTDALFLVDESRYEDVRRARIKRLAYIYNSPPDRWQRRPAHQSWERAETTVFYAGVLIKERGLDSMINAVRQLDGVRLIIGGLAPDKRTAEHQPQPGQNRIEYIGWIPYDTVLQYTIAADILFAFYDPIIPANRRASPNKLFEAMMAAKPIIVSDGTSMTDIVTKENCGIVVPYGDVPAIREAILKLKDDPALRQELGQNGRKAYEQRYSWRIMEQRLLDVYQNLAHA